MPRISKIAREATPMPKALAEAFRVIEKEAALWKDVSEKTRLTYENNYKLLQEGWDMGTARKRTRYVMKAAGLYMMRKRLKQILRESKRILKDATSQEEINKLYAQKLADGFKLVKEIEKFQGLDWNQVDDPKAHYLNSNHKKRPATDQQLSKFYERAQNSKYLDAFLVMEFCGARPQEFKKGIRVELLKRNGTLSLRFTIEGAKCDQDKKGLDIRAVDVPFPENGSIEVKRRWRQLAHKSANSSTKTLIVSVNPTEKQTTGDRITQAFSNIRREIQKTEGIDIQISAYSLRHRVSAQAKQASQGDSVSVALVLGHQSTETQRHYGRANRGLNVSPVEISGVDLGMAQIRGQPSRSGPPTHAKERTILDRVVPNVRGAPAPRRL